MTAYDVTYGPPDLDATHLWTPASGPTVTLGYEMPLTSGRLVPPSSRIRIEQITGWRALPEAEDNRQPRTFGDGEITYPGKLLGKTLVYEGHALSVDWAGLKPLAQSMMLAFANMSDEGVMTVTPFEFIGGVVWTYSARVTGLTFDPKPEYLGTVHDALQWGFQLTLRMSDPHFYNDGDPYV
jgi:hypothetical protein